MIKQNLRQVYKSATPVDKAFGASWYLLANKELSELATRCQVSQQVVTGVQAALSPGLTWLRNSRDTEDLISASRDGRPLPMVGAYGAKNQLKALKIIEGSHPLSVLKGPKVTSFYDNLMYPLSSRAVTVDRHIKYAAYGITEKRKSQSVVGIREYRDISKCITELAENYGLLPCQLQGIIWVSWKRRLNE